MFGDLRVISELNSFLINLQTFLTYFVKTEMNSNNILQRHEIDLWNLSTILQIYEIIQN